MEDIARVEERLRFAALWLKSELAAEGVLAAGERLHAVLQQANFNRNEPRVPKGTPREGGRWAKPGGQGETPLNLDEMLGQIPVVGLDEVLDRVFQTQPAVPMERPSLARLRWPVVKQWARWAFRALPAGRIVDAIEIGSWIYEYYPDIAAYLDPPRSFAELQAAARFPRAGYDIHHIVERNAANDPGFPVHLIESPENLVSISRLRHWELNSWYESRNEQYGGLTPRQYLKGKGWLERLNVGEDGLKVIGVLKP